MLSQRCRVPAETPSIWASFEVGSFQIAEGRLRGWPLLPQCPFCVKWRHSDPDRPNGHLPGRERCESNLARRKLKTIGYSENVVTSGRLTEAL